MIYTKDSFEIRRNFIDNKEQDVNTQIIHVMYEYQDRWNSKTIAVELIRITKDEAITLANEILNKYST